MQKYTSITSDILQEYKSKVTDIYKNHLAGDELKVTLFKIDREHTVFEENSETVYEKIGENSGIRFKKINDYIIFNCTEATVESAWSFETGYRAEDIIYEAVSIPTVVQPNVGDYIHFVNNTSKLLLEVMPETSESSIEDVFFRKIKMKVVRYTEENLLDQTVQELVFIASKDILVTKSFKTVINTMRQKSVSIFNRIIENEYNIRLRKFHMQTDDENLLMSNGLSKLLLSPLFVKNFKNTESFYKAFVDNNKLLFLSTHKEYFEMFYPEYTITDKNTYYAMQERVFRVLKLLEIDSVINNKSKTVAERFNICNTLLFNFEKIKTSFNLLFNISDTQKDTISTTLDVTFVSFLNELNLVFDETFILNNENNKLTLLTMFITSASYTSSLNNAVCIGLKLSSVLTNIGLINDDILLLLDQTVDALDDTEIIIYNPEQVMSYMSLLNLLGTVETFKINYYNGGFRLGDNNV